MNVDAIKALQKLAGKNGKLTPYDVVLEAAKPNSPLHEYFEWDDTKAADAHRLQQARTVIKTFRVEVSTEYSKYKIPFFNRDPESNAKEQGYVSIAKLKEDEDLKREALIAEFVRAASALKRARGMAVYFDMQIEAQELIDKLTVVQKQAEESPFIS